MDYYHVLLCQLIPFGIILWRLARRRQVDGTSCALSRTPVRFKSIAGLLAFNVELVKKKKKKMSVGPLKGGRMAPLLHVGARACMLLHGM